MGSDAVFSVSAWPVNDNRAIEGLLDFSRFLPPLPSHLKTGMLFAASVSPFRLVCRGYARFPAGVREERQSESGPIDQALLA